MNTDERLRREKSHGKFIAQKGEKIWNWSSPAGKVRWARRSALFVQFLGNRHKKVLEIGCGTGLFTQEICRTGDEIIAIDISEDLINLAKERLNKKNVTFLIENAYQTSFHDNSFDFIVGSSSLHHLDIDRALMEIYRLLKPGGRCMFTEPNMLNPQIALQKNIPSIKRMVGDSPDETAFFRWHIAHKLRGIGFKDVVVIPFDFIHPAIPSCMLSSLVPLLNFVEKIPIVREIAGSLMIRFRK